MASPAPVALVTGNPADGEAVAALLRRRSYRVCSAFRGDRPPGPGEVACYVQLPWSADDGGCEPLRDGLAGRLDLLAAVAPSLAPRATVLLAVADDSLGRFGTSPELLAAIATVMLEDLACDARVVALPASELARPALEVDLTGEAPAARMPLLTG